MATDEFDPWSMSIFTSSPFTFLLAVCNMVRGDDALPSMFDKLMYIVSVSSDPVCDASFVSEFKIILSRFFERLRIHDSVINVHPHFVGTLGQTRTAGSNKYDPFLAYDSPTEVALWNTANHFPFLSANQIVAAFGQSKVMIYLM